MANKSSMFLLNPLTVVATKLEPRALTSWKDVALYMGKAVRTVQRWEKLGLPIRRPSGIACKASILAYTDEVNLWTVTHFSQISAASEREIRLSQRERLALPPRVRAYIRALEEGTSSREMLPAMSCARGRLDNLNN